MRYLEHLPEILQNVRAFQAIGQAADGEVTAARGAVWSLCGSSRDDIKSQTSANEADDFGLSRMEKMFGLPQGGELDGRRVRVLARMNNRAPFTALWLRRKLAAALGGEDRFSLWIDEANYAVTLEVDAAIYDLMLPLEGELRRAVPANLSFNILPRQSEEFVAACAVVVQILDRVNM